MADNVVGASVQVDVGNSNANLKEVKKNLTDVKKELGETSTQAKKTGDDVSGAGGHFGALKEKLSGIPGPVGQATQGVTGLGTAFKALMANPIVLLITAIVGALTLLYKAFTSTDAGAEKVEQVFAGLKATIDVLRDRFLKLASAITSFLKGEWGDAWKQAKEAYAGLGDEIANEFRKAADATAILQEIEDVTRDLSVSRAKLNKDLAKTKEIITDENASYADKKKAIDEVRKAEGEQTAQELANAERKLKAMQDLAALSDTSDEDKDEIARQQAEVFRLQEEQATNLRSLKRQEQRIDKEYEAERKAAADKAAAEEKERRQKLFQFTQQLTKLHQENQLAQIKDAYQKEVQALEFKIENERSALAKQFQDRLITKAQYDALLNEQSTAADLARAELTNKHNEETKKKEEEFQTELAKIRQETALKGITDSRELERTQLEIDHQEKLNDAVKRYQDDNAKLTEVRLALEEQFRAARQAQEEKFKEEDEKKKFEEDEAALELKIANEQLAYEERLAAIDQEQALFQMALDNKLISETEYNAKILALAQSRMMIREQEAAHQRAVTSAIGDALSTLSEIAGKQTALGKALAIASTTINTYQSAIGAFKGMVTTIPGPVGIALGAVAAAGAIATGIAAVKKIVSTKIPGGGGGDSGATPSAIAAPAAPITPSTQSTKIDASSTEDIGNSLKGGVKTFVVDADTQNARDRQARLERAATLGG